MGGAKDTGGGGRKGKKRGSNKEGEAGGGVPGAWRERIYLTRELVEEYENGKRELSLDLGRNVTMVTTELEGVPLDEVKGEFVYCWDRGELWKVAVFDNGLYRLRMMKGKPILEIDGLRMHLVKEFDDVFDYSELVARRLGIKAGDKVLDTCMGLGYTAIAASKRAGREGYYYRIEPCRPCNGEVEPLEQGAL
jgi:predicted methyltransferase